MTGARRAAVLGATALALVLPGSPGASAAEPSRLWSVTDWSAAPTGPSSGPVTVSGTISFDGVSPGWITEVTLQLTRREPLSGCPQLVESDPQLAHPDDDSESGEPEPPDPTMPSDGSTFDFSISVVPPCNGTYIAAVIAVFDRDSVPDGESDPTDDDVTTAEPIPHEVDDERVEHVVAAPPPDVASAVAFVAGRTVTMAWQPPAGYGPTATSCTVAPPADRPDFTGYVVQREAAGAWATLPNGSVPVGTQCLSHEEAADVPAGTAVRYRVLAVRDSPAGPVTAAGGSTAVVTVVVDPPPPTTTTAVTPTTRAPRTPGTSRGAGGGPSGGTAGGTVPAVLPDGTYEEELDYPEPGEAAAEVPDDADTFLDFVPEPGPGILVPFAIAECLAVWAFHLRYLARRADDGF